MASVMAEVDLAGASNLLLGVEEHLFPLRDPSRSARYREQHWKHRHRETHRLINEAGVKIDVGIEFALHEVSVFQGWVRPVLRFGGAKKHVEKVARIAEVVVRIDERHAQGMTIRERSDRRNLSDKTIGLLLARLDAEDVFRVVIESGKRGNRGDHHAHGMGVVMKAVEKLLDAFVDESVMRDVVGPILQLRRRGQFTMQEQIRGFQIGAFFREVFDGIAAVTQDAGVAIDVGNLADAGGGVVEGRVIAHHPEFFGVDFDLAEVGGTDGIVRDGDLVGFAGAVVDDGKRFAERGRAFRLSRLRGGEWGIHSNSSEAVELLPGFPYSLYTKGGARGNWPVGMR